MPMDPAIDLHGLMDHQAFRQMLGMDLDQRYLDLRLAAAAVEFQCQRIDATAIDHHQVGRSAVANVAATAFRLDEHIVPGRLAQRVYRIVRHENE